MKTVWAANLLLVGCRVQPYGDVEVTTRVEASMPGQGDAPENLLVSVHGTNARVADIIAAIAAEAGETVTWGVAPRNRTCSVRIMDVVPADAVAVILDSCDLAFSDTENGWLIEDRDG